MWHRGEQVGTRVVHNDRLFTFLPAHTPAPAHPTPPPHEFAAMLPAILSMIDTQLAHPVAMRLKDEREAAVAGKDDDY